MKTVLDCVICKRSIPVGETHYSISFTKERETPDGSVEVLDAQSLLVCCTKCGDKEDIYSLFKKICQEAGVLD